MNEQGPKKAVVLLSGGLDSYTSAAAAGAAGAQVTALTFIYGQRHRLEIESAKRIGRQLEVNDHLFYTLDSSIFGGSSLTDDIETPKNRNDEQISDGIPVTYVPARNIIFLSIAAALAESIGAVEIFIGVNSLDYSGYPDCRQEFIEAFSQMLKLGTKSGVEGRGAIIKTPLINLTKAEIIRLGLSLGVDYSLSLSCYDPAESGKPCGECDSCIIRARGFSDVGIEDPALKKAPTE